MADSESFREETRRWLVANAPASMYTPPQSPDEIGWGGRKARYPNDIKRWLDMMAERGWTAPTWPRAYGGGGLSKAEAKMLSEEMGKLRLRPPLAGFGLSMIGPLLLQEGGEELKREHIPPIVRGEIRWCQGYSEPGAGSDLASLQTRAVREGDHFLVNGQKVWTSYGYVADFCILLVRTDFEAPKHKGLSYLIVDMKSPGVSTRPLVQMTGEAEFAEVFFENVRVPVENLVGELNKGWMVAITTLMHERGSLSFSIIVPFQQRLQALIELSRSSTLNGKAVLEDTQVRQRLARPYTNV